MEEEKSSEMASSVRRQVWQTKGEITNQADGKLRQRMALLYREG
jgi:hypothetical protein